MALCVCVSCEYLYTTMLSKLSRNVIKPVTQVGSQQRNRGVRASNGRLMAAHLRVTASSLQIDTFNLQWARNSGVNDSVSAIFRL